MIDFQTIEIGCLGKTITGKTPSSKFPEDFGNKYMFITPSDDFDNKTIYFTKRFLSEVGLNKLKNKILPSKSVLVSCIGSAMGKITMNNSTAITNQQINSIVVNSEYYDADYIYYQLKNNYKLLRTAALGSTALPMLNKTEFDKLKLLIHKNLSTQKQIAKVLSDLDAKIEVNNNINQELEAMAKTLYDYWFVQFDFPDANGKPYKSSGGKMVFKEVLKREIPEGWEVKSLDEITTIKAGGDKPKKISQIKTNDCNIPIYSNGVKNDGLYGYTNLAKIEKPSITVSARGTIGFSVLRKNPYVPIIRLISITPNSYFMIKFLHERVKLLEFENSGSVQKQLTVPQVSRLIIVVPANEQLKKYHNITNPFIEIIENNKKQNQKLSALRDWLLPMLMNGQVTVASLRGTKQSYTNNEDLGMVAEDGEKYKS